MKKKKKFLMSLVRLYQTWYGKNKFYCSGKLISGPDRSSFYATVGLICIPSILWFIFVGRSIWQQISPVLLFLGILIEIFDLCCLFIAGFIDPGIIPRNKRNKELLEAYLERVKDPYLQKIPDKKEIDFAGNQISIKYCLTCNIFRPPRSSHCSICDNCVDSFDHHCPWVGNCIGRRNYRFFFFFLFSTCILCCYMFGVSLAVQILVAKSSDSSGVDAAFDSITKSPATAAMILFSFMIFCSVSGLGGFHVYLTSTGKTTNEDIKERYKKNSNPYDQGFIGNWLFVMCSPWNSSFIDPTQIVSIVDPKDDTKKLLSSKDLIISD